MIDDLCDIKTLNDDGARFFRCYKSSRRGSKVSHFLFADDCVMFVEAFEKGVSI